MLNVALTGNIAAGKSTVVGLFRDWGATIIDADVLAREAQAPGTDVLAAIAGRFGADVLAPDGTLDRAALRGKVMGDDAALTSLNAIVHPAVQQRRVELQRVAREQGDAILVNDIPLLFEALDPAQFDVIVLVDAPIAIRRTRLRTLRGLSNEDADRMIAAQMPAERKRSRSHHVINNAGTVAQLEHKARAVFLTLRQDAARTGVATLVLCAADAKDESPLLDAIAARYADGGARVIRVTGKAALSKGVRALTPSGGVIVATAAAEHAARGAWADAGRPCPLLHLSPDPDPIAVRLDLRPWGHARVA
ncbi:MAG: dephospho-CoA kinase, partial [Gemmatimonadales bacterium]